MATSLESRMENIYKCIENSTAYHKGDCSSRREYFHSNINALISFPDCEKELMKLIHQNKNMDHSDFAVFALQVIVKDLSQEKCQKLLEEFEDILDIWLQEGHYKICNQDNLLKLFVELMKRAWPYNLQSISNKILNSCEYAETPVMGFNFILKFLNEFKYSRGVPTKIKQEMLQLLNEKFEIIFKTIELWIPPYQNISYSNIIAKYNLQPNNSRMGAKCYWTKINVANYCQALEMMRELFKWLDLDGYVMGLLATIVNNAAIPFCEETNEFDKRIAEASLEGIEFLMELAEMKKDLNEILLKEMDSILLRAPTHEYETWDSFSKAHLESFLKLYFILLQRFESEYSKKDTKKSKENLTILHYYEKIRNEWQEFDCENKLWGPLIQNRTKISILGPGVKFIGVFERNMLQNLLFTKNKQILGYSVNSEMFRSKISNMLAILKSTLGLYEIISWNTHQEVYFLILEVLPSTLNQLVCKLSENNKENNAEILKTLWDIYVMMSFLSISLNYFKDKKKTQETHFPYCYKLYKCILYFASYRQHWNKEDFEKQFSTKNELILEDLLHQTVIVLGGYFPYFHNFIKEELMTSQIYKHPIFIANKMTSLILREQSYPEPILSAAAKYIFKYISHMENWEGLEEFTLNQDTICFKTIKNTSIEMQKMIYKALQIYNLYLSKRLQDKKPYASFVKRLMRLILSKKKVNTIHLIDVWIRNIYQSQLETLENVRDTQMRVNALKSLNPLHKMFIEDNILLLLYKNESKIEVTETVLNILKVCEGNDEITLEMKRVVFEYMNETFIKISFESLPANDRLVRLLLNIYGTIANFKIAEEERKQIFCIYTDYFIALCEKNLYPDLIDAVLDFSKIYLSNHMDWLKERLDWAQNHLITLFNFLFNLLSQEDMILRVLNFISFFEKENLFFIFYCYDERLITSFVDRLLEIIQINTSYNEKEACAEMIYFMAKNVINLARVKKMVAVKFSKEIKVPGVEIEEMMFPLNIRMNEKEFAKFLIHLIDDFMLQAYVNIYSKNRAMEIANLYVNNIVELK